MAAKRPTRRGIKKTKEEETVSSVESAAETSQEATSENEDSATMTTTTTMTQTTTSTEAVKTQDITIYLIMATSLSLLIAFIMLAVEISSYSS